MFALGLWTRLGLAAGLCLLLALLALWALGA